ncbi:MAG TPA: hemerythrin domain-containing protein [Pyrinomonadaceae bacterium]|nr:hemerythrin domain-containing protein [Pyrinomonadaceae bacterium]
MPIVIGDALGNDFNNPLGLLADCHRRIEKFLKVLHTVARQTRGMQLDDEQRQALDTSLRYFRDSAPKHTADEEESLFPRMLSRAGVHRATLSATLLSLNAEHGIISNHHDEVEAVCQSWLANDSLSSAELPRLTSSLNELRVIYSRHMAIEEQDVFPLARLIIEPPDLQSIAQEMAQRRGLTIKDYAVMAP